MLREPNTPWYQIVQYGINVVFLRYGASASNRTHLHVKMIAACETLVLYYFLSTNDSLVAMTAHARTLL